MSDFHKQPLEDILALKWKAGREAKGRNPDEPFIGNPWEEVFEELCDTVLYFRYIKTKQVFPGRGVSIAFVYLALPLAEFLLERLHRMLSELE